MAREIEYEIVGSSDKVIGKVWWDGKKVDSDSPKLLRSLKDQIVEGYTPQSDGEEFVKRLPKIYKNGYIRARKVSK